MSNNNEFADCLVANLKSLNAKERDYLVRYAYQGRASQDGDETKRPWLSKDMEEDLKRKVPGLGSAAKCVFAGMDYHLDWLHAALFLACREPNPIRVEDAGSFAAELGDYEETLRPVTGRHEDLDLLAVFVDGEKTIVLFIEAKGVGAIDTHQLARKLIRLSRILKDSGAGSRSDAVFVPVWVSPNDPNPDDEGRKKSKTLWEYGRRAKGLEGDLPGEDETEGLGHESPIPYLALGELPKKKVTRVKLAQDSDQTFTHWMITER